MRGGISFACGMLLACGAVQAPNKAPGLSPEALRDDINHLVGALSRFEPLRRNLSRGALLAAADTPQNRWEFCKTLAATLPDERIRIRLANGTPCSASPRPVFGSSVEVEELEETRWITIRRFDDSPGWRSVVASFESAEALVFDLRGAEGDDIRGIWPLIETLATRRIRPLKVEPTHPFRGLERAAFAARYPEEHRRDLSWAFLRGRDKPRVVALPARQIRVLVDESCTNTCRLVALALEGWTGARSSRWLHRLRPVGYGARGLVTLPHSRVNVTFPTEHYELRPEETPGEWTTRPTYRVDIPVEREALLASLRRDVADANATRIWLGTQPPCRELPTIPSPAHLPASVRDFVTIRRSFGRARVALQLSPQRADAWLSTCPGLRLRVRSEDYNADAPAIVELHATSFENVSRVLASEAFEDLTYGLY